MKINFAKFDRSTQGPGPVNGIEVHFFGFIVQYLHHAFSHTDAFLQSAHLSRQASDRTCNKSSNKKEFVEHIGNLAGRAKVSPHCYYQAQCPKEENDNESAKHSAPDGALHSNLP